MVPQGPSKFAKSPFFHAMLRMVASGTSLSAISKWSHEQGSPVKPKHILTYLKDYCPELVPATAVSASVDTAEFDPQAEVEATCREIKRQIASERNTLRKHGLAVSKRLSDLQKAYVSTLDTLNKIKLSQKDLPLDEDKRKASDKWTPEFAAAIAGLIVKEKSKSDGALRKFQPERIEDDE